MPKACQETEVPARTEQDGLSVKQAVQRKSLDDNSKSTKIIPGSSSNSATCTKVTKKKKAGTKKKRCGVCNKKIKGRSFLACRCGGHFCSLHRLQADHNCTFGVVKVKTTASAKPTQLESV